MGDGALLRNHGGERKGRGGKDVMELREWRYGVDGVEMWV